MEDSRPKIPALRLAELVLFPTEISASEATRRPEPSQESGTTCPLGAGGTPAAPGSVSSGSQMCNAEWGSALPRGETLAVEGFCDTMSGLSIKPWLNYLVASHSMAGAENGPSWDVPGAASVACAANTTEGGATPASVGDAPLSGSPISNVSLLGRVTGAGR
jgi:hypothetical protein